MTVERVGEVNERDMRENENKERGESDDEVDVPRRGWHVSPSPLSQRQRSLTRSYFTRRDLQSWRQSPSSRLLKVDNIASTTGHIFIFCAFSVEKKVN